MALLNIIEYPDPRLKKVAAPVTSFTPEVVKLVRDMAETMYTAPGVGLAATHQKMSSIDLAGRPERSSITSSRLSAANKA